MLIFAHDGTAQIDGVWTTITAAKQFNANLLNIHPDATHYVRYTTGGTAALQVNETLTGGTSSKTCVLVAQAVEVGTAGSSDTGVLFVKSPSGTFQAETLTGSKSTGTVAIIQDMIKIKAWGSPKAALISVETASILLTVGGVLAATTATQDYGHILTAGQNTVVRGITNLRSLYVINAVNANGAKVKYTLYW